MCHDGISCSGAMSLAYKDAGSIGGLLENLCTVNAAIHCNKCFDSRHIWAKVAGLRSMKHGQNASTHIDRVYRWGCNERHCLGHSRGLVL